MGRPIITTDTPGCSKTVLHGKNGYFVKVRSPLDLSEKMISSNLENLLFYLSNRINLFFIFS